MNVCLENSRGLQYINIIAVSIIQDIRYQTPNQLAPSHLPRFSFSIYLLTRCEVPCCTLSCLSRAIRIGLLLTVQNKAVSRSWIGLFLDSRIADDAGLSLFLDTRVAQLISTRNGLTNYTYLQANNPSFSALTKNSISHRAESHDQVVL